MTESEEETHEAHDFTRWSPQIDTSTPHKLAPYLLGLFVFQLATAVVLAFFFANQRSISTSAQANAAAIQFIERQLTLTQQEQARESASFRVFLNHFVDEVNFICSISAFRAEQENLQTPKNVCKVARPK